VILDVVLAREKENKVRVRIPTDVVREVPLQEFIMKSSTLLEPNTPYVRILASIAGVQSRKQTDAEYLTNLVLFALSDFSKCNSMTLLIHPLTESELAALERVCVLTVPYQMITLKSDPYSFRTIRGSPEVTLYAQHDLEEIMKFRRFDPLPSVQQVASALAIETFCESCRHTMRIGDFNLRLATPRLLLELWRIRFQVMLPLANTFLLQLEQIQREAGDNQDGKERKDPIP